MSETSYTHRVIEAHQLYSSQLGEERTVKVCLPMGYDPAKKYPVLYCHDGLEFFTHGRISTIANKLVAEGKLRPLFIVAIAVSKTNRTDDYALDGRRHAAFTRWVGDDVIPFVEEKYPILADTQHRFMAGISLGAVATLSSYLQYPHLLKNFLLYSGAYFPIVQERMKEHVDCSDMFAFMVVGRQETEVETSNGNVFDFYKYNHAMRDILTLRGAKIDYSEGDGKHLWGFWQKETERALIWLEKTLQAANSLES